MNIRPVTAAERHWGGLDYFLLWAGVGISLAEIWAGGFLSTMGLWLGLSAIIIGHIIGNTLMGLGGIIGSDHGIMSMVSLRPSFGIRGSRIAAVLNIIQLVGWASIMLIIGGRAGAALGQGIGGVFATSRFWIILLGVGTLLWALYTGKTIWKTMQSISMVAMVLIMGAMSWVSFTGLELNLIKSAADPMPFMTGLDLVIAMPISWMPLVADYSRMSKSTSSAFWNTWWGYFIISSWMYILGLVATLMTGSTDPGFLILQTMGTIGLAVPALVLIVLSTVTSDFPDIYSTTCSVMNISPKVKPNTVMWGSGIVTIVVALLTPVEQFENFLLLIGAMFVPLFGVVLTDYFIIRKRRIDVGQLYKRCGEYWYVKGYNVSAIISWAIGFAVFETVAHMQYTVGGTLPSIIVSGLLYQVLTSVSERRGEKIAYGSASDRQD
ncbi:MAG: putative hydroxymethylpyrimidine transporter CytX [Desulfobacterales bacterium]|nr:putative hydroxymethylpyrimidine transporter CytX [Desulfobacterales bacterium]MDD4391859.1 putative hydroxymethylpyrimidine transporter CytX [Desulfobacterales bacterium]